MLLQRDFFHRMLSSVLSPPASLPLFIGASGLEQGTEGIKKPF
jgi:hypothetical protein